MSKPTLNPAAEAATVAKPNDWPILFNLQAADPPAPAGWLAAHNVIVTSWVPPMMVQNNLVGQPVDLIGVANACKTGNAYRVQMSTSTGYIFQADGPNLPVVFDTEGAEAVLPMSVWSAQTVPQLQLFSQNLQSIGNVIPLGFIHWRYQFDFGNYTWQLRDLTTGVNSNEAVQEWQAIKPIAAYTNFFCPALYMSDTNLMAATLDWYEGRGLAVCYPNNTPQPLGPPIMPLVWGGAIPGGSSDDFAPLAQVVVQHSDGVVVWGGWQSSGAYLEALCAARDARLVVQNQAIKSNAVTGASTGRSVNTKEVVKTTTKAHSAAKGGMPLGFSAPILLATILIIVCRRWILPTRFRPAR